MPRKKATMRQTEPKSPWVEIVPQPVKQVKNRYRCYVCNRDLPIFVKDRLEIIPACYLVTPYPSGREDRQELGQICQSCLQCVLEDDPVAYKKRISASCILCKSA